MTTPDRPDGGAGAEATYPAVRQVIVGLCVACIAGEGEECHTPGCVLWLHRVDIPIMEELLVDAPDPDRIRELEGALRDGLAIIETALEVDRRGYAIPTHPMRNWTTTARALLRSADGENV